MLKKALELSIKAAQEAGAAILDIYNSPELIKIDWKSDKSPLTKADKVANNIILSNLKGEFSDCAFLSEEEKDDYKRLDKDYCFIIDPLDGTKEFIKKNGQFTVNIALSYKHKVIMGVVYVPVTGELYYASKGDGAYLKKNDDILRKLRVSDNKDRNSLRIVMSNSHNCEEMNELLRKYDLKNFVKIGSSLKGCMIAAGEADIYYRFNPTMEWDTAAMQCIVEEAGGIFKQMDNSPMLYNRKNCKNDKGFYVLNCIENYLSIN